MKITHIDSRREHLPLTRPYTIAYETVSAVTNFIVEITTEDGRRGFGAASPSEHVADETEAACAQALTTEALGWLLGEDIRRAAALIRALGKSMADTPAARAAVDIALHDLFAQQLDLPLVDVLGRAHHALPTSITIGIKSVDDTLEEAKEYIGQGFRILKVKLGHSIEQDIARLVRLREHIDRGIRIRVDPNQGYDIGQLQYFMAQTQSLNIEFVEQPLPVGEFGALREFDTAFRQHIAADESLLTPRHALELLTPSPTCGIFNIKLMKCGGVAPALDIARIAETASIDLMWGCMDESIISISAALHAALACPATRYLDLDGSFDLSRDVVSGGFVLRDGQLSVADRPGLGVVPLD